jgi:polyene glycosyltransferase
MAAAHTGPILLASNSNFGQINPLLALAGELSRRDTKELWIATTDDRRAEAEATSVGSKVHFASCGPLGGFPLDDAAYAQLTSGPRTTGWLIQHLHTICNIERATADYRHIVEHIERLRPRLVVADIASSWALDAVLTLRVPFIVSVPCPPSVLFNESLPWDYPQPGSGLPRHSSLRQKLQNVSYGLRLRADAILRTPAISFSKQRKRMGIVNPFLRADVVVEAALGVFGYSVFGLEYAFSAPPKLHMLGPLLAPEVQPKNTTVQDNDSLQSWLERCPSVIYVGLGTLLRLSRPQIAELLAAFARLGPQHQVLWKVPAAQQALLPPAAALPGNVRIESWLPSQLDVLRHPHVRVFVTHGGGNGFHEGIYFGKPLYVLPFWLDCYDFAVRAVDSGVGLTTARPPNFTSDEVATGLERLLEEPLFSENSRRWGERLREAGGVTKAADLVLSLADQT